MTQQIMKIALYSIIIIGLCLLGYVGYKQISPEVPANDTPLATFILGEWQVDEGTPPLITNVQFVDERKLEYDVRTSDDGYHETATYQFISSNTIQHQGRRDATIERWQLRRVGEKLEICFLHTCSTFSRETIPWQWMLINLAMIVLAIFFLKKIERKALLGIHPT